MTPKEAIAYLHRRFYPGDKEASIALDILEQLAQTADELADMHAKDVEREAGCSCAAIQAADASRHFKGCPKRVEKTQ